MTPYISGWKDVADMLTDFEAPEALVGAQLLFARYFAWSYEGGAFVLFEREGKLFEVNGSHCSCHGLEGQWKPEETSREALRHRMFNEAGEFRLDSTYEDYRDEDRAALTKLLSQ